MAEKLNRYVVYYCGMGPDSYVIQRNSQTVIAGMSERAANRACSMLNAANERAKKLRDRIDLESGATNDRLTERRLSDLVAEFDREVGDE